MQPHGTARSVRLSSSSTRGAARAAAALFNALEAAPFGVVIFDRDLRFLHLNAWLARADGLPRDAHLGRTLREILPAPFAPLVARNDAKARSVLETGRPATFSAHPDPGLRREWKVTYFAVRGASGSIHGVCGIVADVTEDREREVAIARALADAERSARRLGHLQDVTAALAAARDAPAVAEVVVDRLRSLVGATAAAIRVVRGGALELLAAGGPSGVPSSLRSVPLEGGHLPAAAVRRGEPLWFEDRDSIAARFPRALESAGSAEAMGVLPLSANGHVIGCISFAFDRPQKFDLEERAFLLAAGEQSAQALDRALAREAERASRCLASRATYRLARLHAITAALSAASTVEEVANVLVHGARVTLGAQTAVAYVLAPGQATLALAAAIGAAHSHRTRLAALPLDAPAPAAWAARTGEALWLATRAELQRAFPAFATVAPYADEFGALAALPLRARSAVIGSLSFAFRQERTFGASDRDLLSSVAEQCAQALDRARLLDAEREARAREQRAAERLERLQAITATLSAARTPAEVTSAFVERVHALVHASVSVAYALERDGAHLRLLGARGAASDASAFERLPLDGALPSSRAAASGEPIWLETPDEVRAAAASLGADCRRAALATLPLRTGDRVIGSIAFGFDDAHAFDDAERRFLVSVAEQCAVALDRSRLLEDEHRAREDAERARQVAERAREEAERARSLLDGILENAPLGIGFLDRDLRFQQVNRKLAELNGLPVEAHIGRTPRDLLPGMALDEVERRLRRVLETGDPAENVEIAGETASEPARRVWLASWYPVRRERETIGVGALVRDATGEREAQQFERHVVGVVGHDLRNPLSAIVIATKLLRKGDLPQDRVRLLDRISASASRIEEIIGALLDFANVRGGRGVPLARQRRDLAAVVREVAAECALANPGHKVVCNGEGDCTGEWDAGRIAQLLTNLVSNAIEHSPEEMPVSVRWDGRGRDVVLEVANQGRPIPAEVVPRLFEPFQRGDDARRGGLGLGLFIARAIAAAHRGQIDVRSAEQEGTVFSVRLERA